MKSFITPTYTFTPGAAGVGTINLSGISNFDIKRLLAIINVQANTLIYNVLDPTLGYASISGTTITLDTNTSSMLATDPLQIVYDTDDAITNGDLITAVRRTDALMEMMQRLIKISEALQVVDSAQRQRIAVEVLPAITIAANQNIGAVASVTNVAAQTSMAGMDREMYINIAKQTYAQSIRPNLKFQ
jgi:hypothetical protein